MKTPTYIITIHTTNVAFRPQYELELAALLTKLSAKALTMGLWPQKIYDSNKQECGTVELVQAKQ